MPAEENEISKFCFFGKGYRAPPLNGRETRVVYDENFVKSFYRFPFPREIVAVKFTDNGVFEASPVIALPRKDRSSVLLINLKKEDENEETKEGTLENVQEALNKLSLIKNDAIEANHEVDNNKDEDIKQIVCYDKNKIKDETKNITENGSADSHETSMIVKHQSSEVNENIPVKECNNDGKHGVSDKINIIKNAEKALRNWAKSLSDDLASNNQKSEVKSNEIYSSNCENKSSFLKQNGTSRRNQESQVEESSLLLKVSKSCKSLKIDEKEEKFGSEIQMTRKTFIRNKRTNVESVGVEKSLNENGNACSSNCSNCGKVSESIVSSSCVQKRIKQPKKCICQCSSECLSDFQTARKRIKMCSVLDNTNNKSSSPHRSSVATHTQGTHSLYSSHSSRVHVPEKKMHVSLKQSSAKRINSVITTVVSRNSLDRLNTIRKDSKLIARKKMRRLYKKSRGESLVHMVTEQLSNDRRRTIKTTRNSTENYLWTSKSKGTRKQPQLKTSLSSTTDTAFNSKSLLLNSERISSSEKGVCTSESELCKKNNEMPNVSLGLSLLQSDVDEPFHGFASDIQNSVMEDRNNIVQKEKELITRKFNEANRSSLESLSSIQNSEPKMSDRQNVEDCCGRSAKMNYKNINKIVKEIIDDDSLWAGNGHFSKSSNHIDSSTYLLERLKKNTISNNDLLGISETGSERNTDKSLSESNYSSDETHMSTAQKNTAIASKVGSSRHTVCKSAPHTIGFQDKMLPKRMAQDQDSVKNLSSIAAYPNLRARLLANVSDSQVPPVKRTQESFWHPTSRSHNRPSLGIATSDVANGPQNRLLANVSDSKVSPVKRTRESPSRPMSKSQNRPSLGIATSDVSYGPQNHLLTNVSDSKVSPVKKTQESPSHPMSKSQNRTSLGIATSDVVNGPQNRLLANVSDSKVSPIKRTQESPSRPMSKSQNKPSLGIATSDVSYGPQNHLLTNVSDSKVSPVKKTQESPSPPMSKSRNRPSLGIATSDVSSGPQNHLLVNVSDSKVSPVKRTQESPSRPMSKSRNRPSLGIAASDVSNGLQNCFSANVSDSKVPPVKRIQESFWRPTSRSHNRPSLGIANSDAANGPQNCLSANVSDSKVPPVETIQESFWRPTSKSQNRPSLGNAVSDVTSVATRPKNISSANTESCLNKHSITEKDSPAVYASNGKLHARSITVKRPLVGKAPFAKADSTIRGEIWCVEGVAVPHITNKLQRDSTDAIICRGKELSRNGTSKKVLGVIAQSINIPSEDSTECVDSSQRMPTEMSCSQETTFSNYLEGIEQNTRLGLSKTTQGTTSKIIEPNSKPNLSKRTLDSCPEGGKKIQNNQSKIIEPCSKGTKRTEDHSSKRFKPETVMHLSKRTVDTSSENVKHNSKTLGSKRTQVTPSKKIKTSTRAHETKGIQIASSHVAKKVNEPNKFFEPNPVVFEGFEPNSRTHVAVKKNAISFKGFEPKSRTTVTVETKATSFKGFEPNSRMRVTVKGSTPNSKVHTKVKIRNTEMQKSEGFDSKRKGDSAPSEDTDLNTSSVVSDSHKSKRTKCDRSKSEIKKVPGRVKKHLTSSCSRSIISNKKKSKKQSVNNSSTKQEKSGKCSELYSKQSAIGEGEHDSRSVLLDTSDSSEVGGTEDLKVLKNWSETVTKLAELEVPLTDFESFIAVNNFNIEEQEGSDLGEEENSTESPVKAVSRCHKRRRRWACGNLLKRKNRSRQSTIRKAKQNSDAEFTDAPRCLKEEQEDDVKSDKDFKLQLEEEHEDCFGYAKFPCPMKVEDTESEPLNADAPFAIKMEVTKTEPLNADDYLFLELNMKCEPNSSHGCSASETHVDGRFLPSYSAKTEPNEIHQMSFQRTSPVCKEEPELVFEVEQFSCYYCGFRTKKKILLKQHVRLSHGHDRFLREPKDAVYHWCHVCPYVAEDLEHYVRHISGKHGQLFECQYCDFDTPDEETFTEHVRVDHTELVICPHCDHESVGRLALRTHIHCSHHNLELERCRACFRGFCSSEELKKHKEKHHPKLPRIRRRRHKNFGCTTKI